MENISTTVTKYVRVFYNACTIHLELWTDEIGLNVHYVYLIESMKYTNQGLHNQYKSTIEFKH